MAQCYGRCDQSAFFHRAASGRLGVLHSAIVGIVPPGLIPYHGVITDPVRLYRIRKHDRGEELLRCGVRIELCPYRRARYPANNNFFNHRPVLIIEKKDDIIPRSSCAPSEGCRA